jgi:YggT family protein
VTAYSLLAYLINLVVQLITLLVIIYVFLGYFMSPFHPIRQALDNILNPLLNPIRRIIPSMGMLDFSPLVLIIIVQLLGTILKSILVSIFLH